MRIYLAGGIERVTKEARKAWTNSAREMLEQGLGQEIRVVDPAVFADKDTFNYDSMEACLNLVHTEKKVIRACDYLIVNLMDAGSGTHMEIHYAYQLGIPVYAYPKEHAKSPWIKAHVNAVFTTLPEVCAAIIKAMKG